MITFGWLPLREILERPNLKTLILDYWETFTPEAVKAVAPLDPDWGRMMTLEDAGLFKCWTATDGDLLVGCIQFNIFPHMAFRQTLFALDAGHYIDSGMCDNAVWTYLAMWRAVEQPLRELGVKIVMAHDNRLRPLPDFFARLGYEARSTNFMKVL